MKQEIYAFSSCDIDDFNEHVNDMLAEGYKVDSSSSSQFEDIAEWKVILVKEIE